MKITRILVFVFILITSINILFAQNGSAIRFNSSTSKVVIPFSDDFNFTTDFTIEAWVYVTEHTSAVHTIIEKLDDIYGLYILQTGEADAWITSPNSYADASSFAAVPTSEWHHVALTFDVSAALLRLWVDGKSQNTGVITPKDTIAKSNGEIIIGGKTKSGDRFYGYIDEVRFSKIVRYTTEFDPKIIPNNDINCIALYHFDEGTGNTCADASGKKHPATLFDVQWASVPVSVKHVQNVATSFSLSQNFPNPFKSFSVIETQINESELKSASLHVYDLLGREIANLSNQLEAGKSNVKISSSIFQESGFYFYQLRTEKKTEMKKLTVMK